MSKFNNEKKAFDYAEGEQLRKELFGAVESLKTLNENLTDIVETVTDLETSATALSQTVTALETTTNQLGEDLEAVETTASDNASDISSLETTVGNHTTTLANHETSIEANAGNISNLETELDTAQSTINSHTTTLGNHTSTLSSHTTTLGTHTTAISTLQSDLDTAENTITDHGTRITTLENSGGGGSGGTTTPDYYGTTVAEISALETEILNNEEIFNNGGTYKIPINTKGTNGPFCTLFTRINPKFNSHFTGTIKLYLSPLPTGITTTSLNFSINGGTATALTPTVTSGDGVNIEIPIDFHTDKIANNFKITFTDSTLVDTLLDFAEITSTNTNFLLLNRDNTFSFDSMADTAEQRYYYTKHYKNNKALFVQNSNCILPMFTNFTERIFTENVNFIVGINIILKSNNAIGGTITPNRYYVAVFGENSNLKYYLRTTKELVDMNFANVLQVDTSYRFANASEGFCGVKYDQSVFIGIDATEFAVLPTLSQSNLPSEFICCMGIKDYKIMSRFGRTEFGFFLQHNTGELIFVDGKNATYFLKIGIGTQLSAYLNLAGDEVNLYYHINGKVIKRKMVLNTTTQKWEMSEYFKIFPRYSDYFEANDTQAFAVQNKVWRLITK